MLQKLKKTIIYMICTSILVTSISVVAIKPMEVKAEPVTAVVGGSAVTIGTYILIDLLAVALVSAGCYELYENDDYFASIVDEYVGTIGSGTAVDPWKHWKEGDGTHVLNPNTGMWEKIPSEDDWQNVIIDGKDAGFLGVPEGTVMPKTQYKELYDQKLKELYDKMNEGGGGGQEPPEEPPEEPEQPEQPPEEPGTPKSKNPFPNVFDYLKGKNGEGMKVAVGASAVASVADFVGKLVNGEIDTDNIELNEMLQSEHFTYRGQYEYNEDGTINVQASFYRQSPEYGGGIVTDRPVTSLTANIPAISKPYLDATGSTIVMLKNGTTQGGAGSISGSIIRTHYDKNGTYLSQNIQAKYNTPGFNKTDKISANIPIFTDTEAIRKFIYDNDDSGAVNNIGLTISNDWIRENVQEVINDNLHGITSMPSGKALQTPAFQTMINEMLDIKEQSEPEELTNPEALQQVNTQIITNNITKYITDVIEEPVPTPKPSATPLPYVPPVPPPIDGMDATRDWRLVFPFCIPFDIVDLFNSLIAEPEAPRWEFPLYLPAYGIDYTFVIDFEDFETVAKVLRTCETALFILGLAILTGKVIKW